MKDRRKKQVRINHIDRRTFYKPCDLGERMLGYIREQVPSMVFRKVVELGVNYSKGENR